MLSYTYNFKKLQIFLFSTEMFAVCMQDTRISQVHIEGQCSPGFLKLFLSVKLVCVRVCVSVCPCARQPPPGH